MLDFFIIFAAKKQQENLQTKISTPKISAKKRRKRRERSKENK